MSNISRRLYVEGSKYNYSFGVDRVGGLFLSMFDKEGNPKGNLTQIHPFDERLRR